MCTLCIYDVTYMRTFIKCSNARGVDGCEGVERCVGTLKKINI